nr:MAG: hypothetical protein [Bacteriophage sp.]
MGDDADGETQLLYALFARHHMTPAQVMNMGENERKIVFAFQRLEIEEEQKQRKDLSENE